MSESLPVILAFAMGVLLGTFFYGGLWWTIQKGVSSKQPTLLFSGSLAVRMLIALAGFYFVSRGNWHRLLGCLVGFVTARILVTWFTRIHTEKITSITEGVGL
jgi:F1F0 ATPase subunit 2